MLRRVGIAAASLVVGLGSAGLLLAGGAGAGGIPATVVTRDVAAGAIVGADAVQTVRVVMPSGASTPPASPGSVVGRRATHDLTAGQVLQVSDVAAAGSGEGRARVLVPLQAAPPLHAGDRIDLLLIGGEHGAVTPFAANIRVAEVTAGGPVLDIPARQASAFVYAAAALRLVAVTVDPGAPPEAYIGGADEALAAVSR
jgi:hypothetical protein